MQAIRAEIERELDRRLKPGPAAKAKRLLASYLDYKRAGQPGVGHGARDRHGQRRARAWPKHAKAARPVFHAQGNQPACSAFPTLTTPTPWPASRSARTRN
ncbi:hypothetical protein LP420_21840 [Massilia sp. B-10]|nr:hypothetical protein LP420_21840 [Massilia sp. B-10]